jgi:hypothetical protein
MATKSFYTKSHPSDDICRGCKRHFDDCSCKSEEEKVTKIIPAKKKLYTEEDAKQIAWKAYVKDFPTMSPQAIMEFIVPVFDKWWEENK